MILNEVTGRLKKSCKVVVVVDVLNVGAYCIRPNTA